MQGEFLVWHVMIFKLWLLSSQKQQKKAEESKKQLSLDSENCHRANHYPENWRDGMDTENLQFTGSRGLEAGDWNQSQCGRTLKM